MAERKSPSSIKSTLLLLLLPAGIVLMAVAWVIHGWLLEQMSRDFVESRLKEEAQFLEQHLREMDGDLNQLAMGDYFEKVFHHAFALKTPQQMVAHPEHWQPLLLPLLQPAQEGFVRVQHSDSLNIPADVLIYRQSFTINDQPILVLVAEDMHGLQQSQASFHMWTAVVSLLLILLLVAVIWLGVTMSLRPVIALKTELKALQRGTLRRIEAQAPAELQPMVVQLNQLLDTLEQRIERSREALANLSHSVKTPIAALRQILEDTQRPLDTQLRLDMAARLANLDKQLEAEMRRSRFAGPQIGSSSHPVSQARDLLWMLGRLYSDKTFELSTSLTNEALWPIEEHDLNEILGNLLDNAGKWASKCVELSLDEKHGKAVIVVADDGEGVPEEESVRLGRRGLRLDEQIPGHGLGLAIVNDVLERYNGVMTFSSHQGLKVRIEIPL